jgi:hypothetical protein
MGFVVLGPDSAPARGKSYDVVPADALEIASLPFPASPERFFDLDVLSFYSGDLPGWGRNEGLVKIQVDTRPPQTVGSDVTASFVTKCSVRDYKYAPGFLYRGVFRNVIFGDYLNLRFGLTELDGDAGPFLDKVQSVLRDVPELKQLDILKGIPYLELGTKLVEGILRTFGRNPDDEVWTETPLLSLEPLTAGAYLRRGIYIVFDRGEFNHFPETMTYVDGSVLLAEEQLRNTHLIFSTGVRERTPVLG